MYDISNFDPSTQRITVFTFLQIEASEDCVAVVELDLTVGIHSKTEVVFYLKLQFFQSLADMAVTRTSAT